MEQMTVQRAKKKEDTRPNLTGIPIQMKLYFEWRSGLSFDDMRVHYNSDKPAQLQALAYTQGTQVYVRSGQERHLPHELGHVVQQKLGMVRANGMHSSGIALNTKEPLERRTDKIGAGKSIPIIQRCPKGAKEQKKKPEFKPTGKLVESEYHFERAKELAANYVLDETARNHIAQLHGPTSTVPDKSHFVEIFNYEEGVDRTLKGKRDVVVDYNDYDTMNGFVFITEYSWPIGRDNAKNEYTRLKVVISEEGRVITAYPIPAARAAFTPQAAHIPPRPPGQVVRKGFSPKFALFPQRHP